MDGYARRRMRANLLRAALCLAGGFAAVLIIDHAWDAGWLGDRAAGDPAAAPETDAAGWAGFGQDPLVAFAFDDDLSSIGAEEGVPPDFIAECFSPAMAGDARSAEGGSVVGITSALGTEDLFALCSDSLQSHGWLKVESGWPQRSSFVKDAGRYRWLFLDVSAVADASTAVIVLREAA